MSAIENELHQVPDEEPVIDDEYLMWQIKDMERTISYLEKWSDEKVSDEDYIFKILLFSLQYNAERFRDIHSFINAWVWMRNSKQLWFPLLSSLFLIFVKHTHII